MSERLVLTGVDVVDVRTGDIARGRSVTIDDGKIAAVSTDPAPDGPQVVDASGRFLVPGFNDMHAHPLELADPSGAFELMVAFGITGYRQMSGSPDILRRRDAGGYVGTAKRPQLLATPGALLTPLNAATPELAVAEIRRQAEQGADFIKMGAASAAAYPAAQAEANRLGIPLGGHLPNETDAVVASRSGIRFIEHLGPGGVVLLSCSTDEAALRKQLGTVPQVKLPGLRLPFMDKIVAALLKRIVVNPMMRTAPEMVDILDRIIDSYSEERARETAAIFIENETWQSPTLIRERTNEVGDDPTWKADPDLRFVSDKTRKLWDKTEKKFAGLPDNTRRVFRRLYDAQKRLAGVFAAEGVPMLAGTDITGASWEIPGSALHREFDELTDAGLTPLQVLRATTLDGARFLHLEDQRGSVEVGKSADLVLLDADPTASAASLHRIAGVVSAGHYHSRADLDALLDRAARLRTAA
jgi:imidazolonepropionase-like amidohydrolase